jgi:hypothetical protein
MSGTPVQKEREGNGKSPLPPDLAALDAVEEKLPTLAEVGRRLPIGYVDPAGARHREFDLVPWDWDLEDRLGEVAADNQDMPMPAYVSEVLGHGLSRIGTVELGKLNRGERRLLVRSMFMADVFFAYVWVRIGALGRDLRLVDVRCSECGRAIPEFVGDLGTLEVKVSETVPRKVVKLAHGVEFAGKRLTSFTLQPLRWAWMEADDNRAAVNPARRNLSILQQAVVSLEGAPEGPVFITEQHARTMAPVEIRRLVREVDELGGGPVMQITGECPGGRHRFARQIDWTFGSFFDA